MFKSIIIFGLCVILSVSSAKNKRQAQQCYAPDNNLGVCSTLSNCQYLRNLYSQYGASAQIVNFLTVAQRNCGNTNIGGDPVVCCAQASAAQKRQTPARRPNAPNRQAVAPKIQSNGNRRVGKCTGPDGVGGVCRNLKDCRPFLNRLQRNPQDPSFANFLRLSNEVCRVPPPTVCCPTAGGGRATAPKQPKPPAPKPALGGTGPVNRIPTLGEGCGLTKNTFRKIVGGEPAKVGAWPWIALLGYRDSFGATSFKCGGALVTQRHVLTAAHCIRTDLKIVRLGEHNLKSEVETGHVDINIVKMSRHPSYSSKDGRNDIAVVRLQQGAPFTDFIRPVCLPSTPQLRAKSYVNYTPFVAGWGKTQEGGQSSHILQELQIPIHPNDVCRELYQRVGRAITPQQFDNGVICAGVLAGGKDTCQGDSGGPLMIPESYQGGVRFYVIGIVSYGIGCARPDIPGVYTNVAHFIPWVEQQVADVS